MTGLETIISQIESDAQREAEGQLTDAKAEAEGVLLAAKEEAAKRAQDILAQGERKAQDIRDRAASAAGLESRNAMLAFKQDVIRQVIDSARESMENAPDGEYFDTLVTLAGRFAKEGRAELHLNRRDLDRLPADFEENVKKAAPQADVTLSNTACDIDSGFVLTYGGIDINCTFAAIFEDAEAELHDAVGKILFPGQ